MQKAVRIMVSQGLFEIFELLSEESLRRRDPAFQQLLAQKAIESKYRVNHRLVLSNHLNDIQEHWHAEGSTRTGFSMFPQDIPVGWHPTMEDEYLRLCRSRKDGRDADGSPYHPGPSLVHPPHRRYVKPSVSVPHSNSDPYGGGSSDFTLGHAWMPAAAGTQNAATALACASSTPAPSGGPPLSSSSSVRTLRPSSASGRESTKYATGEDSFRRRTPCVTLPRAIPRPTRLKAHLFRRKEIISFAGMWIPLVRE